MQYPALHHDEHLRLQRLRTLQILDTPPEPALDAITALLSERLGCPISLLTLVDEHRQWFKSRHGLAIEETPREEAFCAHAILEERQFIVADALKDARFVDNPLVAGEPRIRFYAGQRLLVGGQAVGTLCVIDRTPRDWTPEQSQFLSRMATIAEALLCAQWRRHEAALEAADRQRREAQAAEARRREQMEFLARVSHELRTPLNAILSFNRLLRDDVGTTGPAHRSRWLDLVQAGGSHLLALTDDLMTLCGRDRASLSLEPVDLSQTITDCADLLEPSALHADVRVSLPVAMRMYVQADAQALRQVLFNVLGNAIKYSPAGGRVTVCCLLDEGHGILEVSDEGPGIPQDRLDRLFTPFERLGAEHSQVPGTGLGLAIAKTLVEGMHGEISAESPARGGCRIRLALPLALPAAVPAGMVA